MVDLPNSQGDPGRDADLAKTMAALRALNDGGTGGGNAEDKAIAKLPGKGEWVKAAPAVAMVCGTLLIVSFMLVFAVLAVTGTPTDSFFRLINLFLNALGAIATLATLSVALLAARRTLENRRLALENRDEAHEASESAKIAARQSSEAARTGRATERQLNGDFDARIVRAVRAALIDDDKRVSEQDDRSEVQDQRGRRQDVRGAVQDQRDRNQLDPGDE